MPQGELELGAAADERGIMHALTRLVGNKFPHWSRSFPPYRIDSDDEATRNPWNIPAKIA